MRREDRDDLPIPRERYLDLIARSEDNETAFLISLLSNEALAELADDGEMLCDTTFSISDVMEYVVA